MMQEKGYTSEYIFHRQTDENWSSSKAGVQPGTQMLQCFNLQISCCLADSSARNQTVKIRFPGRIRCLRIVFLETGTLSMKLFTLAWRNHRRTEQDHSQRQQKYLSLFSPESLLKVVVKPSSPFVTKRHFVLSFASHCTLYLSSQITCHEEGKPASNLHAARSVARIWA